MQLVIAQAFPKGEGVDRRQSYDVLSSRGRKRKGMRRSHDQIATKIAIKRTAVKARADVTVALLQDLLEYR